MDENYPDWLRNVVRSDRTFGTSLSYLRRIEVEYGDLDALFDNDELEGLIGDLTYSTADARSGAENPSKLVIEGDVYNNLASYKAAVKKYQLYRRSAENEAALATETAFSLSLEADLQRALRSNIEQIEPGLTITDNGQEKKIETGFIDILAADQNGHVVAVELKAVTARRDAVAQTLAYMGDLMDSQSQPVRGVLIAPDFDTKARAAARVVPALALMQYSISFSFDTL